MTKRLFFYLFILILIFCFFPLISMAQNGWVSDSLILTFREGPGNNYNVIKKLTSNTPVTTLEEENGFFKVELSPGEIGWVDKKFIIFEPPHAILLEQARKEKMALEDQIQQLKMKMETKENTPFSDQITSLESSLNTALDEKEQLSNELQESKQKYTSLIKQSKNIQAIISENKSLKDENDQLAAELNTLKSQYKNPFKTAMIKWFLAGVVVLLLGWIIGRSVSSKKKRYGSLLD